MSNQDNELLKDDNLNTVEDIFEDYTPKQPDIQVKDIDDDSVIEVKKVRSSNSYSNKNESIVMKFDEYLKEKENNEDDKSEEENQNED